MTLVEKYDWEKRDMRMRPLDSVNQNDVDLEIKNTQGRLRDLAETVTAALGVDASSQGAVVTSASIRLSQNGDVFATANLKVSRFLTTRNKVTEVSE